MTLTLSTSTITKQYPITMEQAEILLSPEKDIEAYDVFKAITGKDINNFVIVEKGKWRIDKK